MALLDEGADKVDKPRWRSALEGSRFYTETCKPHLPVKSGHMGEEKPGLTVRLSGFPAKVVVFPVKTVVAAGNFNFGSGGGHYTEESV